MLMNFNTHHTPNVARAILLSTGALLLLLAVLFNEVLIGLLDPVPPLKIATAERIR